MIEHIGDLPDRITTANDKPVADGAYVLVVLNRALRGKDNPIIEAAIAHGNSMELPILVYSELDITVVHASDRICYFTLGAFRELAKTLTEKNITCIQSIRKTGEDNSLESLVASAAAIYTDEDYTHWDRAKCDRLLSIAQQTVFTVDASGLIPTRKLPEGLKTTPEFRKAHGALRDRYLELRQEARSANSELAATDLTIENIPIHNFAKYDDAEFKKLLSQLNIDHAIAISAEHPPRQAEITLRIASLKENILKKYKWIRNNPALEYSTSELSPYLHFGMVSPHQILEAIEASEIPKSYTWKFRDEFLTWREWSHYQTFYDPNLHEYDSLPEKAKQTLEDHAEDDRPELRSFEDIMQGNTADATWNAAQKEWLKTGWLHNNLRMYWSKQILRFTESPQKAWSTACYLNDHISLDGRDPATYASMQWAFGNGKPGYSEKPIYGLVAPKSDRAILKREGMQEWIKARK